MNHGVSPSLLNNLKNEIEEFYNLPLEEKMKFKVRQGDVEGYGTVARVGGNFDWGDRFFMVTNPIHRRKTHLLPELPSSMRSSLSLFFIKFFFKKIHIFRYLIINYCALQAEETWKVTYWNCKNFP